MISMVLPSNKYLIEKRGLTESTILAWHLGYIGHSGEVYVDADFQGTLPSIPQAMHHSTMFPIYDLHSNVVSVSVRPLGSSSSKYINTSYEKADHLYGLNFNYKEILKTQTVYVVEGNLSMLTPWQAGIKNIVAMLGSKISHTQLCLLNRFAKKVIFATDGDKAGREVINKLKESIGTKFYDSDMEFSYLELPEKFDPDDFIKKYGPEAFLKLEERKLL